MIGRLVTDVDWENIKMTSARGNFIPDDRSKMSLGLDILLEWTVVGVERCDL